MNKKLEKMIEEAIVKLEKLSKDEIFELATEINKDEPDYQKFPDYVQKIFEEEEGLEEFYSHLMDLYNDKENSDYAFSLIVKYAPDELQELYAILDKKHLAEKNPLEAIEATEEIQV